MTFCPSSAVNQLVLFRVRAIANLALLLIHPCELVKVLFGDRSIYGTVSHEQRALVSTSNCTFSSSMFWSSPLIMCHFINLFLHPPHLLRCLRRVLRDITWPNRSTFQQGVTHCQMCPKLATACQRLPLHSKQLLQVLETCSKTHFEHVLTQNLKRVLIPLSLPVRSRPRASRWEWSFAFKFDILDALYTHILVRTKYTLMSFFVPSSSTVFEWCFLTTSTRLFHIALLFISMFLNFLELTRLSIPKYSMLVSVPKSASLQDLLSLCLNNRKETSSVLLPSLSPEVTCSDLPLLSSACIKANKFPLLSSRKQGISFKNNFMSSSYTQTVFFWVPIKHRPYSIRHGVLVNLVIHHIVLVNFANFHVEGRHALKQLVHLTFLEISSIFVSIPFQHFIDVATLSPINLTQHIQRRTLDVVINVTWSSQKHWLQPNLWITTLKRLRSVVEEDADVFGASCSNRTVLLKLSGCSSQAVSALISPVWMYLILFTSCWFSSSPDASVSPALCFSFTRPVSATRSLCAFILAQTSKYVSSRQRSFNKCSDSFPAFIIVGFSRSSIGCKRSTTKTTSILTVSFNVSRYYVESPRFSFSNSFHNNSSQGDPVPPLSAVTFFVNHTSSAVIWHGIPHKSFQFVASHASPNVCLVQLSSHITTLLVIQKHCSCEIMMTKKDSMSHTTCTCTLLSNFSNSDSCPKLCHWISPPSSSSHHFARLSIFADVLFVHDLHCDTRKPTKQRTVIRDAWRPLLNDQWQTDLPLMVSAESLQLCTRLNCCILKRFRARFLVSPQNDSKKTKILDETDKKWNTAP